MGNQGLVFLALIIFKTSIVFCNDKDNEDHMEIFTYQVTLSLVENDHQPCLDRKGKEIVHGALYSPLIHDPCQQCTCLNGQPHMCKPMSCPHPMNCVWYRAIIGKCCKFVCLRKKVLFVNGTSAGKDEFQMELAAHEKVMVKKLDEEVNRFNDFDWDNNKKYIEDMLNNNENWQKGLFADESFSFLEKTWLVPQVPPEVTAEPCFPAFENTEERFKSKFIFQLVTISICLLIIMVTTSIKIFCPQHLHKVKGFTKIEEEDLPSEKSGSFQTI